MLKKDFTAEQLYTEQYWPGCALKSNDLDVDGWKFVLEMAHNNLKDCMDAYDSIQGRAIDLLRFLIPLEAVLLGYIVLNFQDPRHSIPVIATAFMACVPLLVSIHFCRNILGPQEMFVSGDSPENSVNDEVLNKNIDDRYRELLFHQCKGYRAAIDHYADLNDTAATTLSQAIQWALASIYISTVVYIVMASSL